MARAATTTDVFNAVAESRRRHILDVLAGGEKSVGAVVLATSIPQPQVSRHLKVLSDVGLVASRTEGRKRVYSVHAGALRPVGDWLARFERLWNERLDHLDDLLTERNHDGPADSDAPRR